jgi:spermidine synthase
MTVANLTAREAAAKTIARPHGAPFTKLNAVITQSNANEVAIAASATNIDNLADVVITAADAPAGATTSLFTADIKDLAGVALAKTGVFLIVASDTEYTGSKDANANVTFGTATAGSILASGSGYAIVKTDAAGSFACTATNAADETVYFTAASADGGADAVANGVVVRGCVPADATWAA